MKTVFIYALNEPCSGPDPTAGRTRYIGKAADPYARYEAHLDNNKSQRTHKAKWIRSLLKIGKTPILEILDEVPETEWAFWECEWIRLYRALGFRLTNGTDGGDGCRATEETRAKISASLLGKKLSPERCARMSESRKGKPRFDLRGRKKSEEERIKISTTLQGRKPTDEARANQSAAMKGHIVSEETRLKIRDAHTGMKRSEEARKRMSVARIGKKPWNAGIKTGQIPWNKKS